MKIALRQSALHSCEINTLTCNKAEAELLPLVSSTTSTRRSNEEPGAPSTTQANGCPSASDPCAGRVVEKKHMNISQDNPVRSLRPMCGAQTRRGNRCRMTVEFGKSRCWMHGGCSRAEWLRRMGIRRERFRRWQARQALADTASPNGNGPGSRSKG